MDIHPWTKYEIAQARHEERLVRAMAAMRARELRTDEASEVGGSARTSSWLDRIRRRDITAEPASSGPMGVRAFDRVVVVLVAVGIAAVHVLGVGPPPARAFSGDSQRGEHELIAPVLEESRRIAREMGAIYGRQDADLVAREVSSMSVLETVELMPGTLRPGRTVPAANGIYFAICRRSPCALQRQNLSRERALMARRVALELALRTLDETASDLVVVALPKRWVLTILLVLTRDDLVAGDDGGRALLRWSARGYPADLDVDVVVRQHLYVHGGLAPYSATRDSLLAIPLEVRAER